MKRFLLFSGEDYYAAGGAEDIIGAFNTEKEAKDAAGELPTGNPITDPWWHILDLETLTCIDARPGSYCGGLEVGMVVPIVELDD